MEPVHINDPVLIRALDYSQEAKHRRELAQEAAAKISNPLQEQPANRVTFSQEAQARLNEEKTQAMNLMNEVQVAAREEAAVERRKSMREAHQKEVAERIADRELRIERDHIARDKAEVANRVIADNMEAIERTAIEARHLAADATTRALDERAVKAREFVERTRSDNVNRMLQAQTKETNDLLEKQKRSVVVKNAEVTKEHNHMAVEKNRKEMVINDRVKAETARMATKMYKHIEKMAQSQRT